MIQCAYRVGALFMSSSLPLCAHEWDRSLPAVACSTYCSLLLASSPWPFQSSLRHVACIPPNIDSQCILFFGRTQHTND